MTSDDPTFLLKFCEVHFLKIKLFLKCWLHKYDNLKSSSIPIAPQIEQKQLVECNHNFDDILNFHAILTK